MKFKLLPPPGFWAVALIGGALMVSCHKESINGMELVAEGFGETKAAVDGLHSYWIDGETVRINGEDRAVHYDGSSAYLSGVTEADVYRAIYPSSLNSTATLNNDNVTVTIPATHQWAVDGNGRQVLDVPMAARGTSGSRLVLRHITAAVTVQITNHYGFTVAVDSVVVASDEGAGKYQLSGSKEITLADDDLTVTPSTTETSADRRVKVTFDGGTPLHILSGETRSVQVPVLPVGTGNKFTVRYGVHKVEDAEVKRVYARTQGTGGALARKQMGFAVDTVGCAFTVNTSTGKKVIISQGNLQYNTTSHVWRFAPNQYDTLVTSKQYYYDNSNHWIALFGWGTSGSSIAPYELSARPNGTRTDSMYAYYGAETDIDGTNYDWGVYNAIQNGGNVANYWRTLTMSECNILLNTAAPTPRTSVMSNSLSDGAMYLLAKVNGIRGIVLFPDVFPLTPAEVTIGGTFSYNTHKYNSPYQATIDLDNWRKMEAAGAVFLPATNYIQSTNAYNPSSTMYALYYWTTTHSGTTGANIIYISNQYFKYFNYSEPRGTMCAVRLVHNVN